MSAETRAVGERGVRNLRASEVSLAVTERMDLCQRWTGHYAPRSLIGAVLALLLWSRLAAVSLDNHDLLVDCFVADEFCRVLKVFQWKWVWKNCSSVIVNPTMSHTSSCLCWTTFDCWTF